MGNYGEDIEYSLRLKNMGHNIQYEPDFKVFHTNKIHYIAQQSLFIMLKSQILAHQMHQCSIIEIVWNSFIWVLWLRALHSKLISQYDYFAWQRYFASGHFVAFPQSLVGSVRQVKLKRCSSLTKDFRSSNPKKLAFIYPHMVSLTTNKSSKLKKSGVSVSWLLYVAGTAEGAEHDCLFIDLNANRDQ